MSQASSISALLLSLNKSHIVHSDIAPLIDALKNEASVTVQLVGRSFEQRPIHLLTLGNGPIVVFAWTQMHGNEATATAAVFDFIDLMLSNTPAPIQNWSSAFTLHILPMLNPDGAQRCIRQNAQSIDINRDARELQTPEGQLLMQMVEQLAPDIGFNLHDQSPYYQCGTSQNPATIAFLAPAFDVNKTIDKSRERAMMLISHMNNALQTHIPDCVARYDDTFSVRSFGDTIAGKKVSTILIEAGAAKRDDNRQIARKMNVLSLVAALEYLLPETSHKNQNNLSQASVAGYFAIPENVSEALSSLVIRNLSFLGKRPYRTGVSIKQTARYSNIFVVEFTGDLHIQAGLRELDASGLAYVQGKVFMPHEAFCMDNSRYKQLLREGYLYMHDPLHIIINTSDFDMCRAQAPLHNEHAFILQQQAFCLLADINNPDVLVKAVLNGKVIDLA